MNDLPASSPRIEPLDIPEWGGTVFVRSISAQEIRLVRRWMDASAARHKYIKGFIPDFELRLACMALCDEAGRRLFTDAEISQLAARSGVAIVRIAEVAKRGAVSAATAVGAGSAIGGAG